MSAAFGVCDVEVRPPAREIEHYPMFAELWQRAQRGGAVAGSRRGRPVRCYQASPVSERAFGLAEGPYWDAERQRVLWVDVNAGAVHFGRFDGSWLTHYDQFTVDSTVGAVVSAVGGELLVAGAKHLFTVGVGANAVRRSRLIPAGKASRCNDGGCDPRGRFLIGTLALDDREHDEALMLVESGQATADLDPAITVLDDDLGLSNGLAFSPDAHRLYSIDTTAGIVWRRSYDPSTGEFGPRARFLQVTDGSPDGVCADRDGNLWVAIWGSGEVRCFSPTGEQLARVDVPAPNTSSVAFVGTRLDTLLITTAAEQLSAETRRRYPLSGHLFAARVETTGAPVPYWAGY